MRLSSEGIKERAVLGALSSPIRSVLAETARGGLLRLLLVRRCEVPDGAAQYQRLQRDGCAHRFMVRGLTVAPDETAISLAAGIAL